MLNSDKTAHRWVPGRQIGSSLFRAELCKWLSTSVLALAFVLCLSGCKNEPVIARPATNWPPPSVQTPVSPSVQAQQTNTSIVLHEGDVIKVTFPGAPTMNTASLTIRRDGRVTLPLIGEFKASGLTPAGMEQELLKLYEKDLVDKQVRVTVESSAFVVYVTGAVLRPGKISSDRPITALQAVMEAGGFDFTRANTKSVRVVRNDGGRTSNTVLNLKRVLSGAERDEFALKPGDILYVPERFNWF